MSSMQDPILKWLEPVSPPNRTLRPDQVAIGDSQSLVDLIENHQNASTKNKVDKVISSDKLQEWLTSSQIPVEQRTLLVTGDLERDKDRGLTEVSYALARITKHLDEKDEDPKPLVLSYFPTFHPKEWEEGSPEIFLSLVVQLVVQINNKRTDKVLSLIPIIEEANEDLEEIMQSISVLKKLLHQVLKCLGGVTIYTVIDMNHRPGSQSMIGIIMKLAERAGATVKMLIADPSKNDYHYISKTCDLIELSV